MSYRFMRMLVMFDLPTESNEDRKAYRKFRKFLIDEGFLMHQFSVYSKLLLNESAAKLLVKRLKEKNPKQGVITILTITEKQFARMIFLSGQSKNCIANTDSRLVFLGENYDNYDKSSSI